MLNRGDSFIYFALNEDQEYVYIVKVNIKDICIVKTTEKLNYMEYFLCLPNKSLSSRDNWKRWICHKCKNLYKKVRLHKTYRLFSSSADNISVCNVGGDKKES